VTRQLGLFAPEPVASIEVDQATRALARALPPWLYFGTSSWTFPGWKGIVYGGSPTQDDLTKTGLAAYAAHPLLRTVGVDRSYYGPLGARDLEAYAAQLPPGFQAVSKIWDEITTFVFPSHPRFGDRAGQRNPRFLDPDLTLQVLAPYTGSFAPFAGPFVFELSPAPSAAIGDGRAHLAAIERLLPALPTQFRYGFELRNRELLTPRYLSVLRAHGAAHVLNMWTAMPTVGAQLAMPGVITASFVVARLMLPPRTRYEQLKSAYAPFDRIVFPQPDMRGDVVRLSRACEAASADLFVVANNKAEGSAPLTVFALAQAIAEARAT
jgi:hypothetical protein